MPSPFSKVLSPSTHSCERRSPGSDWSPETERKMPNNSNKPYRVVQWATGTVGASAMRGVIGHPDMELVGVYVYSGQKEGRDAGDLCGLDPVGVKATRNVDEILALKPDCVLYMPDKGNIDELCRPARKRRQRVHDLPAILQPGEDGYRDARADRRGLPARQQHAPCQRQQPGVHHRGAADGAVVAAAPARLHHHRRIRRLYQACARTTCCSTISASARRPRCSPSATSRSATSASNIR